MNLDSVKSNLLLASLPQAEGQRLLPALGRVVLERGDVLCEPGVPLRHLYFPTTAVVSLLASSDGGASTELALTGREGVVGVGLFLGGMPNLSCAVVHVAGEAFRLPASGLEALLSDGGALQRTLFRYVQALLTQVSQSVVCNRHHSVDQALCRWLLMIQDRVGYDELHVTQQLIADSLGVRREAITEAAGKLQDLGAIRYARGLIRIVDRSTLTRRSCGCYSVVAGEFEALLGQRL
ncbi:MAG: Crp/Fnr family transcriptional regulator [Pseudomonadota bacterium]|nr:Crp/Fnr family transcriptional regulator [Pseudomonadota bacterium]